MKGKTFLILLLAAGLLAALAWIRFGDGTDTAGTKMGNKLFADLPVNQVVGVTLADEDNQTTLVKGETMWQVEERNGYPANFDELRDTVVKLSRLKVGRSFSGSDESLIRLSLQMPSVPDATARGQRITLKDVSGKILADLILGQVRQAENGAGGGQYLKKVDEDTVFLVDGEFRFLKTAPTEWLAKEILDIKADAVETVACYAGTDTAPVYTLSRPEKGQAAKLSPIPRGRDADPAKLEQVLDALAPLSLDDVLPAGEHSESALDGKRLVYRLYDGREISIFPAFDGQDRYTLRVTARETDVQTRTTAEKPAQAEGDGAAKSDQTGESAAPIHKTAQQLNDDLSPWIFSIKKWQFDSFITQSASLLEEVKPKGEGTS